MPIILPTPLSDTREKGVILAMYKHHGEYIWDISIIPATDGKLLDRSQGTEAVEFDPLISREVIRDRLIHRVQQLTIQNVFSLASVLDTKSDSELIKMAEKRFIMYKNDGDCRFVRYVDSLCVYVRR